MLLLLLVLLLLPQQPRVQCLHLSTAAATQEGPPTTINPPFSSSATRTHRATQALALARLLLMMVWEARPPLERHLILQQVLAQVLGRPIVIQMHLYQPQVVLRLLLRLLLLVVLLLELVLGRVG